MAYRIHSVATLTGIPATTLRAWERRYQLVSPERTESGYRLYSDRDLSTLLQVKTLLAQGLKIGEAVLRVHPDAGESPADSLPAARADMLDALIAYDVAAAEAVAQRCEAVAPHRAIEQIYMPLMREVGEQWSCGKVNIAQEHLVSMFVRRRLIALLAATETQAPEQREAVLVGAPGEAHELGLLAVAVHLAAVGMRVTYLGLDVPLNDLEKTLRQRRPALLCVSVVRPRPADECLRIARSLRRIAPSRTQVFLGGGGIPPEARCAAGDGVHLVETVQHLLARV